MLNFIVIGQWVERMTIRICVQISIVKRWDKFEGSYKQYEVGTVSLTAHLITRQNTSTERLLLSKKGIDYKLTNAQSIIWGNLTKTSAGKYATFATSSCRRFRSCHCQIPNNGVESFPVSHGRLVSVRRNWNL